MANLKTHLREISPILAFSKKNFEIETLTPSEFQILINSAIQKPIDFPDNIKTLNKFSTENLSIIKKGYKLGQALVQKLKIKDPPHVKWIGNQTQSEMPIDLVIENHKISLKEQSFILENMGLYKLISLLTGEERYRGSSHIFLDYAYEEYNDWFNFSWNYMIRNVTSWNFSNSRYSSSILIDDEKVYFTYLDKEISLPKKKDLTIGEFNEFTTSKIREKVFSKWIKDCLQYNTQYQHIKKICSTTAGQELTTYLNKNLDENNPRLLRLLQIYDEEYIYAKNGDSGIQIFRIPSKDNYNSIIQIKKIEYSIPQSQLNLITRIINKSTGRELILRNEIRFSHGQFNGTPEAKMYYDNSSDLSTIYPEL